MVVLFAGCGVPDPFEQLEPTVGCIGPYGSKLPLHYQALADNEVLLKRLFTTIWVSRPTPDVSVIHQPLFRSNKEVCDTVGGIHITIETTQVFDCGPTIHAECLGEYDIFTGVRLASDGASLLHEFLHTYELSIGVFDTYKHPQWEEKGFITLDETYEYRAEPVLVQGN